MVRFFHATYNSCLATNQHDKRKESILQSRLLLVNLYGVNIHYQFGGSRTFLYKDMDVLLL